jgi:hypothetical protein
MRRGRRVVVGCAEAAVDVVVDRADFLHKGVRSSGRRIDSPCDFSCLRMIRLPGSTGSGFANRKVALVVSDVSVLMSAGCRRGSDR